jgi:hypothetical protein
VFVDRLCAPANWFVEVALLYSTCFIEPNGRNSPVQPSFGVTVFVYASCLFGIDKILVFHNLKPPPRTSSQAHTDDQQTLHEPNVSI